MNILAKCTYFPVEISKIPANLIEKIKEDYDFDIDDATVVMSETDCDKFKIPEEAIDYESYIFDEISLESSLESYVGKHPAYLVFGEHIHWNDKSGYMIVEDIKKTILRNYDVSINVVEEPGNDTIICIESSHDAPTGARLIIKGLTSEETEKLEDCDFDEVENFIHKFI